MVIERVEAAVRTNIDALVAVFEQRTPHTSTALFASVSLCKQSCVFRTTSGLQLRCHRGLTISTL